ncbi:adenylate/guanylate cyclase domain-containing protein [Segnochrobactraceae bacterium EtOH-i3]
MTVFPLLPDPATAPADRPVLPPMTPADVLDWLRDTAPAIGDLSETVSGLCERMNAAGIPVWRFTTGSPLLHPSVRAAMRIWTDDGATRTHLFPATPELETPYKLSPLKVVYEHGKTIHNPIGPEPEPGEFGIIPDLRARGATDYYAMPASLPESWPKSVTITTRAPGGFSEAHLAFFRAMARPLSVVLELFWLKSMSHTLLDTYVGPLAANRVLKGEVRRGDGETIRAVIAFADLRGFTELSNRLDGPMLLDVLNHYFDAVASAVETHGGEVLKFIGDGVLAVFPFATEADAPAAAARAAAAARQTLKTLGVGCPRHPSSAHLACGFALHVGDVFYGNIGALSRLDFTVIGPAVNLASRLEYHGKSIGALVTLSAEMAALVPEQAIPAGGFWPRGFPEAVEVYRLTPDPDCV